MRGRLSTKKHAFRLLNHVFHMNEKSNRFTSVNDAVVVTEREIHHRTNRNLTWVLGIFDSALLRRVHAEDR